MTAPKSYLSPEVVYDQRKTLVKDMMAKENAALDAKTARLRSLRLAKEASEPPATQVRTQKKKAR